MPVAALIGGVVAAGGSIYAANQNNKAAKNAANAETQSAADQLAFQKQALAQAQTNNAPFMSAGTNALQQLSQQFGLGTYTPSAGATSTGANYNAPQGNQGTAAPSYNAYLAANPDLAAEAQHVLNPSSGQNTPQTGFRTVEDYLKWHDSNYSNENRPSTADPVAQTATPDVAPATTTATAPAAGAGQNYGPTLAAALTFTRPDQGSAPALPELTAERYQASPGYQNRLKEAGRTTNASFAAKGLLGSGAAATEFGKRMQDIANEDFTNWETQQLGLYDRSNANFQADRANTNNNFNSDRGNAQTVYDANRNYLTSRFDTNVNNLFNLVGIGQSAANNQTNAGQSYANNASNVSQNQANSLSNYYGNQASTAGGLAGNLVGIGSNILGNYSGSSGSGGYSNNYSNYGNNVFAYGS